MASNLDKLDPRMKEKVLQVIDACADRGIEMRPGDGLRDPLIQARYWRQSRSTDIINQKIAEFREKGAPFLAACLEHVGPQSGQHVTDTPPGISWHQWGEAVDCVWIVNGRAEWSTTTRVNGLNGYHVYADGAENVNLTAGGHWPNFKDWPHLQLRSAANAASVKSLPDIDAEMAKRFGHLIDWPTEIVNATVDSNTTDYIEDINGIVAGSPIRNYDWRNRGRAPIGYIKGIALMYARSYLELKTGQDSAVKVMCQPLGGGHKDAITHYGINADSDIERLRSVYTLALGLGMRESSGNTTEGRDLSVPIDRVTAASAEAGLFQVSYDSFQVSPWMRTLSDDYGAGKKSCMREVFMEGVRDKRRDIVGTGPGADFQKLTKECPAFATEYVMLMLRLNRTHFGPINRKEAEYKPDVEAIFKAVENVVDN